MLTGDDSLRNSRHEWHLCVMANVARRVLELRSRPCSRENSSARAFAVARIARDFLRKLTLCYYYLFIYQAYKI